MYNIRSAETCDSEALTKLSIESEAYWGGNSAFIEKFKAIYKVTEEFICSNPTFIMEEAEKIIGFYAFQIEKHKVSLEYFYIEVYEIGKGYGKLLWKHAVEACERLGIKEFEIVTSPEAKEFYIKMGAKACGEVESLVMKGRIIPRLVYTL